MHLIKVTGENISQLAQPVPVLGGGQLLFLMADLPGGAVPGVGDRFNQLEKGRRELDYLNSVLENISLAEGERDLAEIRQELTDTPFLDGRSSWRCGPGRW